MKRKQVLAGMVLVIAATTVLAAGCKKKGDIEVVATVETAIEETTEAETTTAPVFTWGETLFGTTKNLMITKEINMYLEPRFDAEVSHQTQEDVYYWFMGYVNDGDWYVIKEFLEDKEVYYVPANEFPGLSIEKTDDVEETAEAVETEETAEAVETKVEETIGVVESVEAAKSQAVTSTKAQTAVETTVQAPTETTASAVAETAVAPTESPTVAEVFETAAPNAMEEYLASKGMTTTYYNEAQKIDTSNYGVSEYHNDNIIMN